MVKSNSCQERWSLLHALAVGRLINKQTANGDDPRCAAEVAAFPGKGVKRPQKVRRCRGRDFTGLRQLSTQGAGFAALTAVALWLIAAVRMRLIWRQRRQQFAVGWDLLARGWEEHLVQGVHDPRPKQQMGRRRQERKAAKTAQRWRAAEDQCGRRKKKKKNPVTSWFYWQFPMFSLHMASLWFPSQADLFEACGLLEVKPNM